MTYAELKKLSRQPADGLPVFRLAVMGDVSTQHLSVAMRGHARAAGLSLWVNDADYNQIRAQLTDASSETYAFTPDAVLIYMSVEKLYERFCQTEGPARAGFADAVMETVKGYWAALRAHSSAPILQMNFAYMDDACYGSYALKTAESFAYQAQRLNFLFSEACLARADVYPVDLNGVQSLLGRRASFDSDLYGAARLALSMDALVEAAARAVGVIRALTGRVKKCVVTDLDQTLWGGVIGDDGLEGIQIGELGEGRAFTEVQTWLKELKKRGILLAVCSKNEPEAAREPFLKHPDMVLRLDDFAAFTANWRDKAQNIREIQKKLNIGMDSMVFLDDNPFERSAVRAQISEITVPEIPADPARVVEFLREMNLFETASWSSEDEARTLRYRQEALREEMRGAAANYDDYLKGLHMRAVAAPFDAFHIPRIAQLTQRSNQFNLRTVRYTEALLEALPEDAVTRYYTLKDDMGDYGLIGVVILRRQGSDALFIDTWLMSCRVLKRGMEEFIANDIVASVRESGCRWAVGEYLKTPKNAMVEDLYPRMGFKKEGERYVCDALSFVPFHTYIDKEESL